MVSAVFDMSVLVSAFLTRHQPGRVSKELLRYLYAEIITEALATLVRNKNCTALGDGAAVLRLTQQNADPGSDSLYRTCSPNACSNGRKPSVCGFFVTENWIFEMVCKFLTEGRSYTCDHFAITKNGLSQ